MKPVHPSIRIPKDAMPTANDIAPLPESERLTPKPKTFTFDSFVEYGRKQDNKGPDEMPWHFVFHGHTITHETDDVYLIGSSLIRFERGQYLTVSEEGAITINDTSGRLAPRPTAPLPTSTGTLTDALDAMQTPQPVALAPIENIRTDIHSGILHAAVYFLQQNRDKVLTEAVRRVRILPDAIERMLFAAFFDALLLVITSLAGEGKTAAQ